LSGLAGFYSQDPEDCKKEIRPWSLITDCEFVKFKMDEGGWVGGGGEIDHDFVIWLGRVMSYVG